MNIMTTKDYIPTLLPADMNNFHAHSTSWRPLLSNQNNQDFHINRLEDISDKSNFHVLPHRKTVHDFILLKKEKMQNCFCIVEFMMAIPVRFP